MPVQTNIVKYKVLRSDYGRDRVYKFGDRIFTSNKDGNVDIYDLDLKTKLEPLDI